MSTEEKEDDTQFRCMLCDFTATSKAEIGNHFLTDHMEAYVSPVKEELKDETTNEEESAEGQDKSDSTATQAKKEAANEDQENEAQKEATRPRGRPPKKRTQKPIKKQPYFYIEEIEDVEENQDEEPQQFGRGMRRRKRATPRHILRYELDDEDGFVEDEDYVENEKKKILPKKKFPAIMPHTRKDKATGRGRKRGRPRLGDRSPEEDGGTSKVPRGFKRQSVTKLPLGERVVELILNDRVAEWYTQFQDKYVTLIPCPFDGCTLTITHAELEVHLQCHAPNLEGFRCPIAPCDFLCPHWSNMRVHYRKEHHPLFHKLVCNERGCSMVFPRIDQKSIQIHVTRKHLRPVLHEELMSPDFDKSKYEKYITAAANEETSVTDASQDVKLEGTGGDGRLAAEQELTTEKPPPVAVVGNDVMTVEMEEEAPKVKKRGRPRGSTKAAKLARIAAGEIEKKGKRDKKGKGKRQFTRAMNHVAFFCDVCGGKYKSEEAVYEHKAFHYRGDNCNIVYCTECQDFSTEEPNDIREHVSTFHKSLLHLHRCDMCSFSTNRYHDLKKHLLVHSGSKDYMCDKCGTCTTTAYNLRVHWRRYHAPETEKKIGCFACNYRCADNGILKEHIRSKHGLMVYGKDYNNARPLPTYSCPQCTYIGRKKSSLTYHMRIHTENRQFKCHICPYASKTKNNLLLHIRTHEGLQPLKCPECDFRGATNKIISEHVMCKHARIRPYTCKICGWTSSYHGNMWKHVENHRRDLGESMPDEPVSVIASDDHMIAAPLKAPTLKKRGSGGSPGGSGRTPKMKGKRSRSRYEEMTNMQVAVDPQTVQTVQSVQDDGMKESVVIQLPVSSVLDSQTITLAEGISEEAAMGASALSRLAQGTEITVREVHFLHSGDNQQPQHHEMITYNVPPVAVTQQIIAGGDMGHVINEQHYQHHPQHHHHDHQQHHPQHDQEREVEHHYGEGTIQTVQVVTSQENGVPQAVTEQVVHAMPQQQHHHEHHPDHRGGDHNRDQTVVHQLIPMTLPHEAELVMSMMQAHQASISQAQ